MAIEFNPNIPTDRRIVHIDPANPKCYGVSIAGSATNYTTGAWSTRADGVIILNTTSATWAFQIPSTISRTGRYTVQFEYWSDVASSTFNIDNDGVGDNLFNTGLTCTTSPQTYRGTASIPTTGASQMYFRRNSGGNIYIRNYKFFYADEMLDMSGNGYHFTTNGTAPTYSTNNGGIITFTSGNYFRNMSIDLRSSPYTVIGASRYSGGTNGRIIDSPGGNNWLLGHWGSTENHYAVGWVSATGAGGTDTNWRIYAATGNQAQDSWSFYVNGVSRVAGSNGGSEGPRGLGVNANTSEPSNGEFGFLIAYDRILTDTEIKLVYDTYKGRYGI